MYMCCEVSQHMNVALLNAVVEKILYHFLDVLFIIHGK
jgi:hypothetical protein